MSRYAMLLTPGANRVYGRSAPALGRAELAVVSEFALGGRLSGLAEERLGGVAYLTFDARSMDTDDIAVISNLSGLFALFERDGPDRLRPVDLAPLDRWDDDLITIQRFRGKTNEQLTRLLVNLAVVVGHGGGALRHPNARLRVVDPLCGRGTTLNQAVMYGFDGFGVESDRSDVDAYVSFFATWLKNKRIRHHVDRQKHRVTITLAATKAEQKDTGGQRVVVIADDTTRAVEYLGKNSADALVADLPYGIQHGSRARSELSRRPLDLLNDALPVWRTLLRPGSAMVLAWNTRTLSREAFTDALETAGLEPVGGRAHAGFAHQVDSSITRDLIIARRPA